MVGREGSVVRVSEADSEPPVAAPETVPALEPEATAYRRDRLLAALTLMFGTALVLSMPFALRAGAEFFLPVTAALVIAIALVPVLEWLERRRVPSALAAFFCVVLFLAMANIAVAAIVFPITAFVGAGFEHSVANMYVIPAAALAGLVDFDPAAVAANLVVVTAGNIIGGAVLVALVYWLIFGRKGVAVAEGQAIPRSELHRRPK